MLATFLYLAAGIGVITHVAYLWKGLRRLRELATNVRERVNQLRKELAQVRRNLGKRTRKN